MIKGSCLCGTVRFAVDGGFDHVSHCHCSMCRKMHGAAFGTYGSCPAGRLHWLAGEDAITHYRTSTELERAFCSRCGAVVPGIHGDRAVVPVGNLDDDAGMMPSCHIFAGSAAPWHAIADDLPRYETWPGEKALEAAGGAAARREQPAVLHGGCQCGAVAFEVVEPFVRAHNCHCTRCRKGRSAAHASNAFTSFEGVRFTRGEDNVVVYKLPEAKFFSIAFCRTCGSGLPRLDPERRIAVIPLGALDDDPGRGVDSNIFVDDAAAWYPAVGEVPGFPGPPS